MRRGALIFGMAMLLVGCRDTDAEPSPIDADNPLEVAARDANLVADAATTPPIGLFERRHAAGSDSLCLIPDGDAYRFAITASFGTTLSCEGGGAARHDGNRLSFDFDGAECAFVADYDGNAVRLPGTVPAGCSALCGPRASLSGVAVDRVGWDEADARRQCN